MISVSWVMNGYNLVLTVLFLTMGRLADRYGHKLVFMLGLALFTAASLPCALATSVHTLVAWRVVQAVGAAAVVPTALALLLQAFPERRQGFAAGLFGAAQLARRRGRPGARRRARLVLGLAGRVLVQPPGRAPRRRPRAHAHARPAHAAHRATPLDWPGVGLVSAGLFCLTLAIIQGNDWGWVSAAVLGLFAGGAALLLASGCGGSCALPLPSSTCASSATAPSPPPAAPS